MQSKRHIDVRYLNIDDQEYFQCEIKKKNIEVALARMDEKKGGIPTFK